MDWQAVQTSTECGGPGGDRAVLEAEAPLRAAATAYGRDADLGGAPPAAKATASPAAAATKACSPAR